MPHMFLFCLCSAVCLAWRYNHDLLYYAQTKRPKIIAYSRQKARMGHTIVHTARHCRQDRIVDKAKCNVKKKTQLWGMSTFFFFCARIIHTQTRCVGCTHLIVLQLRQMHKFQSIGLRCNNKHYQFNRTFHSYDVFYCCLPIDF